VKLWISVGLPVVYAFGVFWATRSPPPKYASPESTAVTVKDEGGPEVLHAPDAIYPAGALRDHIEGTVTLRVQVDGDGSVARVEPVSGPRLLIPAAVEAVRQWQFSAKPIETEIQVPFLLWHPGPRSAKLPEPLTRIPAIGPAGIHGLVRLVAMVNATGRVDFVHPVSGPSRLIPAAVASVKQWVFRPALRDGKPDPATAVIEVAFR
jgi:TonB family protein